jgi:putative membrane protein
VLAVAVGVVLLVVLLEHAGLDELHDQFDQLRWLAPLVLLPYLGVASLDVISWRQTLPAAARATVPFHVLFLARMAGEAVNSVTPTATLGGEPVKAHLLRAYGVSVSDGLASIVVAKTALTIAQSLFTAIGIVGLLVVLGWMELAVLVFVVFAAILTGMTYLLLHVQQRNPVTTLWRTLARVIPRVGLVERFESAARSIDERLQDFYRGEPEAFAKSTIWNFAGWLFGVIEVQLMLTLMGHPISWLEAFVIEAVAQPIRAVAIVIPGGLGAQEWGGVTFCHDVLGMPEPVATTLWLLKRGRELVFDAVGLVYLARRSAAGAPGA